MVARTHSRRGDSDRLQLQTIAASVGLHPLSRRPRLLCSGGVDDTAPPQEQFCPPKIGRRPGTLYRYAAQNACARATSEEKAGSPVADR